MAGGQWWAEFMEIPRIVMAGTHIESALDVAQIGSDFVALSQAVFSCPTKAVLKVSEINALPDKKHHGLKFNS